MRTLSIAILVGAFSLGGCPASNNSDTGRSSPDSTTPTVVTTDTFTVTLPTPAKPVDATISVPGATFAGFYQDDSGNFYEVIAWAPDSLPGFSAEQGESTQYTGVGRTSSGDYIILGSTSSTVGDVCAAMGMGSNGELLFVATNCSNPGKSLLFGAIDLLNTDGLALDDAARADAPTLLNSPARGTLVLSDGLVYRLPYSPPAEVASWKMGDPIYAYEATGIQSSSLYSYFILKIGSWRSVSCKYVGSGISMSSISGVTDLDMSSPAISLADSSHWSVVYQDESMAMSWDSGDAVAVFTDQESFTGYSMLRLSTGDSIRVSRE